MFARVLFANTVFTSILLLIIISGCTPKYKHTWKNPDVSRTQAEKDFLKCEAEGYKTAGPAPVYHAVPECSDNSSGFSCGWSKGKVRALNRNSKKMWKAAFNAGFKSCMYDKGYEYSTEESDSP